MHSVSVVEVIEPEGRTERLHVFAFESHAERFRDAVKANGGSCEIEDVPLNSTEDHLTALILSERDV